MNREVTGDDILAIKKAILQAKEEATSQMKNGPDLPLIDKIQWPVNCTVGPGLEGAIACETEVGYVNGARGQLVYRGYDIFDLCAHSTFEEVCFLLLHGYLPNAKEYDAFRKKLNSFLFIPNTIRLLESFPVERWSTMSALRLGVNFMRQKQTFRDDPFASPKTDYIATDEDSFAMETPPRGTEHAVFEFFGKLFGKPSSVKENLTSSEELESCYRLISGVTTMTAAIARLNAGNLPIEPDPALSHAANLLYMMTGRIPTPLEERIMDICLILHADHGMNASTFAAMVVASTLSDLYFSVGAGISALNGPLHGGANEQVMITLKEIGSPKKVQLWFENMRKEKKKIPGFGHRVYKTYDPRARILSPLASLLAARKPAMNELYLTAKALEKEVVNAYGDSKKIFPNVDFYSGLVYSFLGIGQKMFTPLFATSRVAGWTARILEYMKHNRIFRPRALYTGPHDLAYTPIEERTKSKQAIPV
jgi:citrate synthase